MYDLILLKGTNFGNNDRVWNVPSPTHDFGQYTQKTFSNIIKRLPLLATGFVLSGEYTDDLKEYDYLIVRDLVTNKMRYYFVDGITGDRNIIMLSVILDTFTTYDLLATPITGTLIRKHDTNINEKPFDYPTALQYNPMYETHRSELIGVYTTGAIDNDYIESSVNLIDIPSAKTIEGDLERSITVPLLTKPNHKTGYSIVVDMPLIGNEIEDSSGALTLYKANSTIIRNLNILRGLAGDGAISDSFRIPRNFVEESVVNGEVMFLTGKMLFKTSSLLFYNTNYVPKNIAISGMFKVELSSLSSGDTKTFPSWAIKESINVNNNLELKLWCDPKPNGSPYCTTKIPPINFPISTYIDSWEQSSAKIENLVKVSVVGSQWLKNPLIYSTGKGEIFASVETQLQREKSAFEMNSAMTNLEISQREKDIRIAQQRYSYEASQTMGIIGIAGDLLSGDIGGALSGTSNALINKANQRYIQELQALKNYEGSKQSQLIKIAHSNNLRSLNVQENIRRVVAPEVVYRNSDGLSTYERFNSFRVNIIQPDVETLKSKDMEYSLYGYPVLENVENFVMTNNLRQNQSIFMFSECIIDKGGDIGDITREFLRSGIRILSSKYSINNLINNPK